MKTIFFGENRFFGENMFLRNEKKHATGEQFNLAGHSLANMKFTILEIVRSKAPLYRKEREACHIKKFNTCHKGINRSPGGS